MSALLLWAHLPLETVSPLLTTGQPCSLDQKESSFKKPEITSLPRWSNTRCSVGWLPLPQPGIWRSYSEPGFLSLLPASFIWCQTPQDLRLPCLAAAEDNAFPVFLISHQILLHVSQMLCLSLFLPIHSSSKGRSGTEMHTDVLHVREALFTRLQRCPWWHGPKHSPSPTKL